MMQSAHAPEGHSPDLLVSSPWSLSLGQMHRKCLIAFWGGGVRERRNEPISNLLWMRNTSRGMQ